MIKLIKKVLTTILCVGAGTFTALKVTEKYGQHTAKKIMNDINDSFTEYNIETESKQEEEV